MPVRAASAALTRSPCRRRWADTPTRNDALATNRSSSDNDESREISRSPSMSTRSSSALRPNVPRQPTRWHNAAARCTDDNPPTVSTGRNAARPVSGAPTARAHTARSVRSCAATTGCPASSAARNAVTARPTVDARWPSRTFA